ncbi:MAG: hypothetical protein GX219_07750 [Tissierellia bacterium]|nr:hypothetical protein [Tissierellia bacterium]
MRECKSCRVKIKGIRDTCPLCHNKIDTEIPPSHSPFPTIPLRYKKNLAIKLLIFISLTVIIISFSVYYIFPSETNWPLLVLFGVMSMWMVTYVIVRKTHNLAKAITFLILIVSFLLIFWDKQTGDRGWAVTYAIPILNISAIISMFVTVRIVKLAVEDYILYFVASCFFGLAPFFFVLFRELENPVPSVISIALSLIMLVALAIFRGREMWDVIKKKAYL